MKKIILGILVLTILKSFLVFANDTKENIISTWWMIQQEAIVKEGKELKSDNEDITKIYEKAISISKDTVDSWFSQLNTILAISWTLYGILFFIWGAILVWFINNRLDKINSTKEEVDIILREVKWFKEESKKIKEYIEDNPRLIYKKIIEGETKYIFERLERCPQEIQNVSERLSTRDLDSSYFEKLFSLREKSSEQNDKSLYLLLIFQHFPVELFSHEQLWINNYEQLKNLWQFNFFMEEKIDVSKKITEAYLKNPTNLKTKYEQFISFIKNDTPIFNIIKKTFMDNGKLDDFEKIINPISLTIQENPLRGDGK